MTMRQLRRNRQFAIFLLICSFFFSACGGFTARVSKREKDLKGDEVGKLLLALKNQNLGLTTFKGVGKITLYRDGQKNLSNRIAWIGASPDRLRTVLSGASGRPFLSFASDGQWFYFFDHSQVQFYKRHANHSVMKKTFSVPINSDDIISILAGRIPVHQHRSAVLLKDKDTRQGPSISSQYQEGPVQPHESKAAEDEVILVLKGRWGNVHEKIYLDGNKKNIRKIEVFDFTGALAYRAELNKMQNVNGYRVPAVVVFSNEEGSGFQLEVERYWPHVHVEPSMFVLSPPKP